MVTTSFPSLDGEAGGQKGQTTNTRENESMGDQALTLQAGVGRWAGSSSQSPSAGTVGW